METLIILDLVLKITAKNQHSDAWSSSFQRVRTVPCEQYQEMGELEENVNCLHLSRFALSGSDQSGITNVLETL